MTPPAPSEVAVAVARAIQDDGIAATALLKAYIADGADPAAVAFAAARMLALADKRLCELHGKPEGAWLTTVAVKAARQRSES